MSDSVLIPGLGHSLFEDGSWRPTDETATVDPVYEEPRTKAARRKAEEESKRIERLHRIWEAMAYR